MPSEFHRLFHRELERVLPALETKSQMRTIAEIERVNLCSNDYPGLAGYAALLTAERAAATPTALAGSA